MYTVFLFMTNAITNEKTYLHHFILKLMQTLQNSHENHEEIFSQYHIHSDICNILNYIVACSRIERIKTLNSRENENETFKLYL